MTKTFKHAEQNPGSEVVAFHTKEGITDTCSETDLLVFVEKEYPEAVMLLDGYLEENWVEVTENYWNKYFI